MPLRVANGWYGKGQTRESLELEEKERDWRGDRRSPGQQGEKSDPKTKGRTIWGESVGVYPEEYLSVWRERSAGGIDNANPCDTSTSRA